MPSTGGLYAPTLRYDDGVFYIACTNAVCGPGDIYAKKENFIISTRDIWKGGWSDPVYFEFDGIDPSITFDEGRVYVQASAGKIIQFELNLATGKRLSEERTIWTGTGGANPEAPHIFKHDGWYHLLTAEGGTHATHSATMARSKSIWGPYEPSPRNPTLTARDTDEYVQHAGHCDVFQDGDGEWWAACLGVRRRGDRYVLGRESFLTPARWEDGWLRMEPIHLDVVNHKGVQLPNLSFLEAPNVGLINIRDAQLDRYRVAKGGERVTLTPAAADLDSPYASPTFIAKRQRTLHGRATTSILFHSSWAETHLKLGLACYKDEHRFFRIYFDAGESAAVSQVINAAQGIARTSRKLLGKAGVISFEIGYTETEYILRYALGDDKREWVTLDTVDALEMTDPDFVGPIIGVFAIADRDGLEVEFEEFHVD